MAGGRSERMRASYGPTHKSLVRVAGMTLVERNLCALIAQGFLRIEVVFSSREPAIGNEVESRLTALAKNNGAIVRPRVESEPLGNIGIVQQFKDFPGDLLVTYADNISTIDLREMLRHHRETDAALTIAVHEQQFQPPFGKVVVECGKLLQYNEKPRYWITASSGFFILKAKTACHIRKSQRMDIAELFALLKEAGEKIVAFQHSSLWVDVNDLTALRFAEDLIEEHPEAFGAYLRGLRLVDA